MKILILIPTKPTLCPELRLKSVALASRLHDANPGHELTIVHDHRKVESLPADSTAWSKVTRARQALLASFDKLIFRWDYVLWIDADLHDYPADMPTRLQKANPDGIAAPMVFIEGYETRFYDVTAFLESGSSHIEPTDGSIISGRNLSHYPPYWKKEPTERIVPVDCVGTIVLCPVNHMAGHQFFDHPTFTDWFTLCQRVRKIHGVKGVVVDRDCVALHADLGSGKYPNESWH